MRVPFYLRPGKPGDRLRDDLSAPRLLVGVATEDFASAWERIYHQQVAQHFRGLGLRRDSARRAASEAISHTRQMSRLQIPF